jgi:type I restriction enzyme S subunit
MRKVRLSEVTVNLDSKRKPLNNIERNRMKLNPKYPYFGANGQLDMIDDYIFDEEIICIAEDGGNWSKGSICSYIVNEKCWVNNHAHVLKTKNDLNIRFLMYYLNDADLSSSITGTTRGKLTKSALNKIEIPLPPLETQKKIVEVLDKAQGLIDARKEQIRLMDELIQSVFYEMFGDPMTNPKGWDTGIINDLTFKTQYGTSKKAHETDGEYPVLRMNNITYTGGWDFSSLKYSDLDEKELEKYLVYEGELLFNRTNSKELVGKTAVYRETKPMAYAGYLVKLKTNSRGNTEYISAYLNSQHGKATLLNMAKSIVGMANINAEELKKIKINLPPIDVQNDFAAIVSKIEKERSKLSESIRDYDDNYSSIMQKAFAGKLI